MSYIKNRKEIRRFLPNEPSLPQTVYAARAAAQDTEFDLIDTSLKYTWQIDKRETTSDLLVATAIARSGAQILAGCDGCKGRHVPERHVHCSAAAKYDTLESIKDGIPPGCFRLVSIKASRKVYPGVWIIERIEAYTPGYSTCRIICKRRTDTKI